MLTFLAIGIDNEEVCCKLIGGIRIVVEKNQAPSRFSFKSWTRRKDWLRVWRGWTGIRELAVTASRKPPIVVDELSRSPLFLGFATIKVKRRFLSRRINQIRARRYNLLTFSKTRRSIIHTPFAMFSYWDWSSLYRKHPSCEKNNVCCAHCFSFGGER